VKRLSLALGLAVMAAVFAACGGTDAAPPTGQPSAAPSAPAGDSIVVVAKDLTFLQTELTVPAGEPVEIILDNQEAAPHNIAISDASGASVFKGEIVSSKQVTNAVPALEAGTYTFICEVHPDMKGTITAQ
jgi:plastocyanin